MNKKILLVSLIFLVIFFSGCLSIDIYQKINSDGSSEIEVIYDISKIVASGMAGEEFTLEGACENATPQRGQFENIRCTADDKKGIMTISFSVPSKDMIGFTNEDDVYQYDALFMLELLSNKDEPEEPESENDTDMMLHMGGSSFDQEFLAQMNTTAAMFDTHMTLVIEMPGEITQSDLGIIDGNKVTINMFDMIGSESVLIKSKGSSGFNIDPIYIVIPIAVILIIILIIILVKKKPKKETASAQSLNDPKLQAVINWIQTYEKQGYSEEQLRKTLLDRNYSKELVDEAFSKK